MPRRYRAVEKLSSWRKLALAAWDSPRDPTAYGMLDLDAEPGLAWVAALRERTGAKVTLTHLVGKAAALAIAERPEVNAFVSGATLVQRETVDVFFQVAFFDEDDEGGGAKPKDKANLAGAKVASCDRKSVDAIAAELGERARAIRKRADAETANASRSIARLPSRLVGVATRVGAHLSMDWGVDLSKAGIPRDPFGSCMITNVGTFGIQVAWAPLLDMARSPLCITLGAVREAPSVKNGAVVAGKRVTIGVAFDHRVLDGFHAGVLAKRFTAVMESPAEALGAP
jgi:pyruvate dehydrogenase E2 component (dihydrolipoamide acetyltransferase)